MLDKKRWLVIIGMVVAACTLAVTLIIVMTSGIQQNQQAEKESTRIQSREEESYQYKVCAYRGHIGIYDKQGYLQSEVMVDIEQLPVQDRKRLQKGILLQNPEQLYALMEDYTG